MRSVCFVIVSLIGLPGLGMSTEDPIEHFVRGEFRSSLSWDGILAMETGTYKFGASCGVHVKDGLELGMEQQFILPPDQSLESRTWSYLRYVPFREWMISPFLSPRLGYYHTASGSAVGLGAGMGAVFFVSKYFAFETSLYLQYVLSPDARPQREADYEWRMVIYY